MREQADYQKFIILSSPRSGSSFLQSLLSSHSQIICHGELFNPKKDHAWSGDCCFQNIKNISEIRDSNFVEFLKHNVFIAKGDSVKALGFKILYYQVERYKRWQNVLDYLAALPQLRVIHLKRKNLLHVVVSDTLAKLTGFYHLKKTQDLRDIKELNISLSQKKCLDLFRRIQQSQQRYDQLFKNHLKIDIYYEDFLQNQIKQQEAIQSFLEVSVEKMESEYVKIPKKKISLILNNYSELKEKFSLTPYSEYFNE